MAFNLTEESAGDVLVLSVSGRLDSTTAPDFEQGLLGHLDRSQSRMVLDCTDLEYISSAGLRVILMGAKKAKLAGGQLVLCGLRESIREVLAISGFLTILSVRESRAEALALAGG